MHTQSSALRHTSSKLSTRLKRKTRRCETQTLCHSAPSYSTQLAQRPSKMSSMSRTLFLMRPHGTTPTQSMSDRYAVSRDSQLSMLRDPQLSMLLMSLHFRFAIIKTMIVLIPLQMPFQLPRLTVTSRRHLLGPSTTQTFQGKKYRSPLATSVASQ